LKTAEARVSYNGDRLKLSAGYYGSFFNNRMDVLQPSIAGGLNNPLGSLLPLSTGLQSILSQPVALAPDNQAHQFDVTGSFAFTPTTGLNFKLAQAQATQNQDFASSGLTGAPAGVTSLGGNMVTTKAQVGLTSRPIPKLALQAELRWEDRDDRTPIAAYNLEGTGKYTNRALPLTTSRGKLQASYQLPWDLRAQLGTDIESIDRGVFTATSAIWGTSALRQRTDETTVRAELRRRLSESVAGAITVSHAERDGSRWLRDNSGVGVTEVIDPYALANGLTNAIFMPNLADRQRDKAKLNIEWKPIDEVSLQLVGEHGTDSFSTPSSFGVRRTGLSVYGLDWDYAITPRWSVNGYWSRSQYGLDQARPAGTLMSLDNVSANLGLGLTGKPTDAIELGASLNHVNDVTRHAQRLDNTAANDQIALLAATGGLPDIVFRQTAVKLFGKFAIDKVSAVRVDLVHQRTRWNDWAWAYNGTSFTYSDGTTLSRKTDQHATGVAMTYSYKW
jgi:MtrB/PioB family decaheme-associated outer membrane protein